MACDIHLAGAMVLGLLLLLLWPQACLAGPPALSAYRKIQRHEGETLSVQCSYNGPKNYVETKVWCKVRIKKCEPRFPRPWVTGPRYIMQDNVHTKIITVTMVELRQQDSGRYWCMRDISGMLYPMQGFLLEVFSGLVTERSTSLIRLRNNSLKSRTVITTGRAPTSGPDTPFTSTAAAFTPGPLTWASLWPSTALGILRPTSATGSSLTSIIVTMGPRSSMGSHPVTASPAGTNSAVSILTRPSSSLPTSGTCRDRLPPTRLREPHLTALVVLLSLLPAPVMLAMIYKFWKKKHMGSYSLGRGSAGPWTPPVRRQGPVGAHLV
ncbi:PREDICTED: trem-like transcript 2 protein isoform X2 [Chinchilla lanigera]|uniref:trem-like transcript 2 protein isoform X2 n=1 Tax=Chinchilla lanigera TaxID=34839 RepID=UPI000696557C|nr:PREDICTED: trem-like transcript 2 protein isoform X2 [Chinchilla lanigera]